LYFFNVRAQQKQDFAVAENSAQAGLALN